VSECFVVSLSPCWLFSLSFPIISQNEKFIACHLFSVRVVSVFHITIWIEYTHTHTHTSFCVICKQFALQKFHLSTRRDSFVLVCVEFIISAKRRECVQQNLFIDVHLVVCVRVKSCCFAVVLFTLNSWPSQVSCVYLRFFRLDRADLLSCFSAEWVFLAFSARQKVPYISLFPFFLFLFF
jgi:hypothetical protein